MANTATVNNRIKGMAKSKKSSSGGKAPAKGSGKDAQGGAILKNAVGQIEKTFGKGSIMKLAGDEFTRGVPGIPTGALSLDIALGDAVSLVVVSLKFMGRNQVVKPHWLYMRWPVLSKKEELPPSSMPNMLSTQVGRNGLV